MRVLYTRIKVSRPVSEDSDSDFASCMHAEVSLLFQTPDCIWESGTETHLKVLCSEFELIPHHASWSNAFVYAKEKSIFIFDVAI